MQNLIDTFLNKKLNITLIESLPKEKTQILGTAEIAFGSTFLKYQHRDPDSDADETPLPPPPLHLKETVPITYNNLKLLPPPSKDGEIANLPEITIEASISCPLIDPEVAEAGNFLTIKLDDLHPVPEEWTLKEGTEKDMNSSK